MPYNVEQLAGFLHKEVVFLGHPAVLLCDGKCDKAWGINCRPKIVITEGNEDDFYYIPDGELGLAPDDPGTYEGAHAKPRTCEGPDRMNRWCARECERSVLLEPLVEPFRRPPNFERRVYNFRDRQMEADQEA